MTSRKQSLNFLLVTWSAGIKKWCLRHSHYGRHRNVSKKSVRKDANLVLFSLPFPRHGSTCAQLNRVNRRPMTSFPDVSLETCTNPDELYQYAKHVALRNSRVKHISEKAVFSNHEISLRDIWVWGFDYDYTIATYNTQLNALIYSLILHKLVHTKGYPKYLLDLNFEPDTVRIGLHYDTQTGLIMKLDAYHNIQLNTVYRGHQRLKPEEVFQIYEGGHVSFEYMSSFFGGANIHHPKSDGGQKLKQLTDLFAVSQIALLSDVQQLFIDKGVDYAPEYLYGDVYAAVNEVHISGEMHNAVAKDPEQYLDAQLTQKYLAPMLQRLNEKGRKTFLMTNSSFYFVDAGMKYLMGPDWRDAFDLVICDARKPSFFSANEKYRPFRRINSNDYTTCDWTKVRSLDKGSVYLQGSLSAFTRMTGWSGGHVLYFGDHVYGDLAEPSLRNGWRTGAIINELKREIELSNTVDYCKTISMRSCLEDLIEKLQVSTNPDILAAREKWKLERDMLKEHVKDLMHPKFGSIFRCYNTPSYFSRRLSRFADLYTWHLCNFINYPVDRTFYPNRYALPHERYFLNEPLFSEHLSPNTKDITLNDTSSIGASSATRPRLEPNVTDVSPQ